MDPNYRRHARRAGLIVADPERFTVHRTRAGTAGGRPSFRFRDRKTGRSPGRNVTKAIRSLGIPPAWEDVRCASDPRAHILAVGTDGSGRRQYVYNPAWERVREAIKAERLLRFGRALPRIRARVERDLRRNASARRPDRLVPHLLSRLAAPLAARLVDRAAMRPGNEAYAAAGTRGATTLRAGDVSVNGDTVRLHYVGKGGREHEVSLRDAAAARALGALRRTRTQGTRARATTARGAKRGSGGGSGGGARARGRGTAASRARLFAGRAPDGTPQRLTAARLNRYLAEAAGEAVSAKDFRTFHGSARALAVLHERRGADTPHARRAAVAEASRAASERLRNTPAVARASYVLPSIVAAFEAGELPDGLMRGRTRRGLDRAETALMRHMEAVVRG